MKIAVITDVHANLPALKAGLAAIRREGVDAIYHTGDAVGYGPFPGETLELLLSTPRMHLVLGNHDRWFASNDPEVSSEARAASFDWFYDRVDPAYRKAVARWPYVLHERFEAVRVTFVHFGLDETGRDWVKTTHAGADVLDRMFSPYRSSVTFFGHTHVSSETEGQGLYVNPGALGVAPMALARYAILETHGRRYNVRHAAAPYDDTELFDGFRRNNVPNWELYARLIYGRD